MSRQDHQFQFRASEIADAALAEAEYHDARHAYWRDEFGAAYDAVEKTIGAKITKVAVTGGERFEVHVDYGDPAAYRRMGEAQTKMSGHQEEAELFRSAWRLYGTQGERVYELSVADVAHFRLGQGPR